MTTPQEIWKVVGFAGIIGMICVLLAFAVGKSFGYNGGYEKGRMEACP